MKKETLEAATKKYINDDLDLYESLVDGHISYNIGIDLLNKLFTAGAKWQAERMYTKDDVLMAMGYAVGISYDGRLSHIEIKKSCIEMLDKIKG